MTDTANLTEIGDLLDGFPIWMLELYDRITFDQFSSETQVPRFLQEHYSKLAAAGCKIEDLVADGASADELIPLLRAVSSNAAIQLLSQEPFLTDSLPDDTIFELLSHFWTEANLAVGPLGASRIRMLELLLRVGFISDGTPAPTEPTDLYHGLVRPPADPESDFSPTDTWDVLCWTTDKAIAERFATKTGRIYIAKSVSPKAVLGRFDRRGESEYIIDPLKLKTERIQ